MDLRSRGLHWPTIELKNWSRGSCRAKHPRKAVWNPRSSSMKVSRSLRVRANWGIANGSPAVRYAGNICCLLVLCWVYGKRYQEKVRVSIFKRRCRVTVSQVRRLLAVVLPLKVFHADEVLRYVAGMQQRHHRAYLSHRKRRLHEILH